MGKAEVETSSALIETRNSSDKKLKLEDFPLREEHSYQTSACWFDTASVILEIDENDSTWSQSEILTSAGKIKTAAEHKLATSEESFVNQMLYFDIHNQVRMHVDQVELPALLEERDDDYITCDFKNNNHDVDWIVEIEMQGEQTIRTKDVFPDKKTARSPEITAALLSVISGDPELKGRDPYQDFLERFNQADQKKIKQAVSEAADHEYLDQIDIFPVGDLSYKLKPIGMVRRERKVYLEPNQNLKDIKNLQKKSNVDSIELG